MNLTSLFNFNYLKENIKKSKATILLCILLIPIINGLVFLINTTSSKVINPDIYTISSVLLIGIYVIPIVLSITLFSFVYKKGSIDFTLSLPINKKQIFLTNTLGGIVILSLMQLINFIILLTISLLSNGVFIDYKMLFDIFLIYTITYIFVFTSCNIAVSISANKITTVVVTMLILFLIPFITTFINFRFLSTTPYSIDGNTKIICTKEECKPQNYKCYTSACEKERQENIYYAEISKIDTITYTMPYELIKQSLFGFESTTSINTSLIKMFILSIVYILIGLPLFIKKKFEVVGISFKSEKFHIITRTLTTIPIICVSYIILKDSAINSTSFFGFLFLLILTIAYLIIYDLITRKKVTNFFKMLICILIVSSTIVILDYAIPEEENIYKDTDFKYIDIKSYNGEKSFTSIKDQELITYITSILLDNELNGPVYSRLNINAKIKNKYYQFYINVNKTQYEYINSKILIDKSYQEYLKKVKKYNPYAISLNNNTIYLEKNEELYKKLVKSYQEKPTIISHKKQDSIYNITLYIYDNYQTKEINFSVQDNQQLKKELLEYYNNSTKNKAYKKEDFPKLVYSPNESHYDSYSYPEINNFIKNNLNSTIDVTKEYKHLEIVQDGKYYVFVTDKVKELDELMKKFKIADPTDEDAEGEDTVNIYANDKLTE